VLAVDNGSSDGTYEQLAELARELPVTVTSDPGPFEQGRTFTALARQAHAAGADWVLPLDADEFWLPCGDLHELLGSTKAGALSAPVVNFAQRRGRRSRGPRSLLTMTRRVAEPVDPAVGVKEVERRRLAYVEVRYPAKHVVRAGPRVVLANGNHWVRGVPGRVRNTDRLTCLHAPLRTPADLALKAEQGERVEARGFVPRESWHVRRWSRMAEEDTLAADWAANSYRDGCLDVYGHPRALVRDSRLREAVAPFV
jgi:glycosyltransferase involved in cell wall biosynthesis